MEEFPTKSLKLCMYAQGDSGPRVLKLNPISDCVISNYKFKISQHEGMSNLYIS